MKKSVLLVITFAVTTLAFASKDVKPVAFETGSNVCFIGDSITHGGKYIKNVVLFYATRYPSDKINFYNVGIGGDGADYVNKRLEKDVLSLSPNFATLMIGMNNTGKLTENPTESDRHAVIENRQRYEKNLNEIIKKIKDANCRLILFAPSPYDENAKTKVPVIAGKHSALEHISDICRRTAFKYNLPLVDMWNYMMDIDTMMQKKYPKLTMSGSDRVHPNDVGGYVMMANFIRTLAEHRDISRVEIDAEKSKLEFSYNCDVSKLKATKTSVTFKSLEYSLPFPLNIDTKFIDNYIHFTKDYNRQIIKVMNLQEGIYNLFIDGKMIGKHSSENLSKGINIGNNPNTPQNKQAVEVEKAAIAFRDYCVELREIDAVELWRKLYQFDTIEARIAKVEEDLKENKIKRPYIKERAMLYKERKLKQAEMFAKSRSLFDEIYKVATPKKHTFELKKIETTD